MLLVRRGALTNLKSIPLLLIIAWKRLPVRRRVSFSLSDTDTGGFLRVKLCNA